MSDLQMHFEDQTAARLTATRTAGSFATRDAARDHIARSWGLPRTALLAGKFIVAEFVAVTVAAYATSAAYHSVVLPAWPTAAKYGPAALIIAILFCCASLCFNDFRNLQNVRRQRLLWNGVKATALAFSFFLSGLFLLKIAEDYSRGAFLVQFCGVSLAVLSIRGAMLSRFQTALARGEVGTRRAFLIGPSSHAKQLARRLRAGGITTVAQYSLEMFQADSLKERQLIETCRALCADDIFVLAEPADLARLQSLTDHLAQLPAAVHVLIVGLEDMLSSAEIVEFGDVKSMQVLGQPLSAIDELSKRALDIAIAASGLIILSPLLLLVAAIVKLTSRGPALFRQLRHGYNNQAITVLKFRSMYVSPNDEFRQAERNDPRVTWFGEFIRSTSIDELPQLINVLRGEMSIVGPRPHATAHNKMFEDRILPFSRRHNVKPGITGWAQVNLMRGETDTLEKMQKRVDLDLFYIDNWSFYFDLKIIVMTTMLLFSKKNFQSSY